MAVRVSLGFPLMVPAVDVHDGHWTVVQTLVAVGYWHLGEGTLGSRVVRRGPESSWELAPWEVILPHLSHR